MYQFKIRHLSRDGTVKRDTITDYLWLQYRKVVNDDGLFEFEVRGDHSVADNLRDWDLFEVWWRNQSLGVDWHKDFEAVYRDLYQEAPGDVSTMVVTCPGQPCILNCRIIAWPDAMQNRSVFSDVPAENVFTTLVKYNATELATVGGGRDRNGNLATSMGFTIVVAGGNGRGERITRSVAGNKLMDTLRELSSVAGGDWSLQRAPVEGNLARWVFRFHPGQLGRDLTTGSGKILFSLKRGNMANPILTVRRQNEGTVAIARGQGAAGAPLPEVVQGADYSPLNDIEMFVDGSGEAEPEGVRTIARQKLKEAEAAIDLSFDVKQTPSVFYSSVPVSGKKTYTIGDIVSASFAGYEMRRKISSVTVTHQPSESDSPTKIDVETIRHE